MQNKKLIDYFQQYETIRSFGDNIYIDKIGMDEDEMDQINLLENWKEFSQKSISREKKKIEIKKETLLKE